MTDYNFTDDMLDLDAIVQNIKPNILTPSLPDIVSVSNEKKPKLIAGIIVRQLHKNLTNPVTKDILHKGKIHKIKYFDIEPLITGVWPVVSLMILQLSYGEQVTIIESLYPEKIQLTAKAFAINFTPDVSTTNIQIENNTEITDKLDSANAGIATIISMLGGQGYRPPHPDRVKQSLTNMHDLVTISRDSQQFADATKRAFDAAKHKDKEK